MIPSLEGVRRDLHLATRSLFSNRAFFVGAVAIVATGLAASLTVFSVVNALLLRPLPVEDQDSVVRIWKNDLSRGYPHFSLTYPEYLEWQRNSDQFEGLAALWAWGGVDAKLIAEPSAVRVNLSAVSENYFDVLGVSAAYGRTFRPDDNLETTIPPVVLSYAFWRRYFGEDRSLIGELIPLVQRHLKHFRVVGILPPGFDLSSGAEAWSPALAVYPNWKTEEGCECDLIGRLRRGVSLEQGRAELQSIHEMMVEESPNEYHPMQVVAASLLSTIVGDAGVAAVFLFGGVLTLLILAVANLAGLFLIRTLRTEREIAVLHAMGADFRALVRPVVLEAALITLAGILAGAILAYAAVQSVVYLKGDEMPRLVEATIDWRTCLYAVVAAVACCLGIGLIPGIRASRSDFREALRGRSWRSADLRLMKSIILVEIALASVVLFGASLLVRTLSHQEMIPRGVDAAGLLSVPVDLPEARYATPESKLQFFETAAQEIQTIPGVEAVTPMMVRPGWGDAGAGAPLAFEGQTSEEAALNPYTAFETVDDTYFETLRIPLKLGRVFTKGDRLNTERVVIVSESISSTYWPGEDPLEKTVVGGTRRFRVVGVVTDTRMRELRRAWHTVYFPVRQNPFSDEQLLHPFLLPRYLAVRTARGTGDLTRPIQARLRQIDSEVLVDDIATMEALLDRELSQPRFNALVSSIFGMLALALAAIGLFAIVSAFVAYRAREVALRVAVGATPRQIKTLLLARGLRLTMTGVAAGAIVAMALSRFVGSQLYGVSPQDPVSFLTVVALLSLTMVTATFIPTSRAVRINPAAVLRQE